MCVCVVHDNVSLDCMCICVLDVHVTNNILYRDVLLLFLFLQSAVKSGSNSIRVEFQVSSLFICFRLHARVINFESLSTAFKLLMASVVQTNLSIRTPKIRAPPSTCQLILSIYANLAEFLGSTVGVANYSLYNVYSEIWKNLRYVHPLILRCRISEVHCNTLPIHEKVCYLTCHNNFQATVINLLSKLYSPLSLCPSPS